VEFISQAHLFLEAKFR